MGVVPEVPDGQAQEVAVRSRRDGEWVGSPPAATGQEAHLEGLPGPDVELVEVPTHEIDGRHPGCLRHDGSDVQAMTERQADWRHDAIGDQEPEGHGVERQPVGKGDAAIGSNLGSKTSTKGEGAVTRSESIDLLVAAVVTEVLPNGNLVISGSQEVRVNYEVRVLSVAGVLRPRDIATDNTVSYDKIAEARISYGGRGRITEVQQPGWGHQLFDLLLPF